MSHVMPCPQCPTPSAPAPTTPASHYAAEKEAREIMGEWGWPSAATVASGKALILAIAAALRSRDQEIERLKDKLLWPTVSPPWRSAWIVSGLARQRKRSARGPIGRTAPS